MQLNVSHHSDNDSNFDSAEEDLGDDQNIQQQSSHFDPIQQNEEPQNDAPQHYQPERRYPARNRAVPATFQYSDIVNKKFK